MTEPADAPKAVDNSPPPGKPDDVLDTFKAGADGADNETVHDAIGGRPRLSWSPVTDGGGRAPTDSAEDRSSFHFDLGGALARLGDPPPKAPGESRPAVESVADAPPTVAPPATVAPLTVEQVLPEPGPASRSADPIEAPSAPSPAPFEQSLPQRAPSAVTPPETVAPPFEQSLPQRAPVAVTPSETVAPPFEQSLPVSAPSVVTPEAVAPPFEQSLPQRAPVPVTPPEVVAPPLEPLPRRGDRSAPEAPVAPVPVTAREPVSGPYVTARRSVFDDSGATAGTTLPPSARAHSAPIIPPPSAPVGNTPPVVPTLPPTAPLLPTLPAATPHAMPMYTPPLDSAPSTPDINAFRSAQLRASRQQRRGKMFSRTMLALFLIGGLVAAALVFGRRYLFPTEWDQTLTPIVDEIQNERGVEFDHTVGLVKQPSADYALTTGRLAIDDDWLAQVPVWRALGLTTGEPTVDGIAPALAADRLAVYDPDADRIYMNADASADAAAGDLRLALEQAYAAQNGTAESATPAESNTGFLGVSPPQEILHAAIDSYIARREASGVATTEDSAGATATAAGAAAALPLPIEYQMAAIDDLGEALLSSAGVDPTTARFGAPYPDNVGAALDDHANPTASGALQVGDRSLAPAVALGVDDWSLVWGSRLPQATVDQLASIVVADSFRPIDRAGLTCAISVFETANPTDAATVLAAMQTWAAASPAAAQATATQLADTRIQLSSCDPGADAATSALPGDVDAVINRQLTRLAG